MRNSKSCLLRFIRDASTSAQWFENKLWVGDQILADSGYIIGECSCGSVFNTSVQHIWGIHTLENDRNATATQVFVQRALE